MEFHYIDYGKTVIVVTFLGVPNSYRVKLVHVTKAHSIKYAPANQAPY